MGWVEAIEGGGWGGVWYLGGGGGVYIFQISIFDFLEPLRVMTACVFTV